MPVISQSFAGFAGEVVVLMGDSLGLGRRLLVLRGNVIFFPDTELVVVSNSSQKQVINQTLVPHSSPGATRTKAKFLV